MDKTQKKISVVVPTYNQAEYLGACLDSILFQDYPDLEIVVVADPSPDATSEVLRGFARAVREDVVSHVTGCDAGGGVVRTSAFRYPQEGRSLVIVENETRLGHGASYNLGFRLCTGDYCTYVASDDICHPQMLSTLAAPLDRDEADFVYSDMFIVDDAGRILREFRLPDYGFDASFCDWYLCGVSKLYRRELHERLGFYDEGYIANDHECYLRFAMNGARFLHLPKTLYSVRSHDQRARDLHDTGTYRRLYDESAALVRRAREWAATRGRP
ncbi:glycosyltransferase [Desulfovibrio aminophilus]|nr:glycosyltransferase [Desulfovibrio aminophilus]MCM0753980.1 glycosyltransferase [Desulfovibrio aminophilus]